MSKLNIIILVAIAVFILITGYLIFGGNKVPSIPQPSSQNNTNTGGNTPPEIPIGGVLYTKDGFSPKLIRFKSNQGAKVIFSNTSSSAVTIEPDPTQKSINSDALKIGVIEAGKTKTVTLPQVGIYSFRNSVNTSQKGSLEILAQ